ncbi:Dam family site-specific DNA-(adenine-N6)-methyltransferase [Metamycoplasma hyosynoviae]|uniref:Dam family site-specific DNA-(adenine-N6)-methyltransferase n=1 Tax=Metamycoplasma hyosynoviae TaxID=29559 RepID=UPI002358CE78|nr:Dam family site-specific DNA-(adenine-N6)-methyltransferase [Metamycoplasma hyosynoviae]MDC8917207.1 Dam family site-specific DNA-(adenine-N6)-methyltransferase [Metamycoplasma hyosynoviae]
MTNLLRDLGKKIKNFRQEVGMTLDQLSSICEIEKSLLFKMENDDLGDLINFDFSNNCKMFKSLTKILSNINSPLHPFVKWAGGKTQLLNIIENYLPKQFNRYFEPFVGGGALLFKVKPLKFSINDINNELICTYKCFKDESYFNLLKNKLIEHEKNHSEEYYYKIREMDKTPLDNLPIYERAARMLYLNKACFNGLYRVNSKGYFNVPSGKKEKVICFDRQNFENLHSFFKNREFEITNIDFEIAVENAKEGDFVYFDPPYDTLQNKNSFTSYNENTFGKKEQIRLSEVFKKLSEKKVFVMLSNHNTKLINELYKDFHITIVPAKRMINSRGDKRGEVEEVIITNYE